MMAATDTRLNFKFQRLFIEDTMVQMITPARGSQEMLTTKRGRRVRVEVGIMTGVARLAGCRLTI